jgi:hypothetical protein
MRIALILPRPLFPQWAPYVLGESRDDDDDPMVFKRMVSLQTVTVCQSLFQETLRPGRGGNENGKLACT